MIVANLSEDIKSAISKNLSAEVATSLKEFIAQAERDKKDLEQLKQENIALHGKISAQDAEISARNDLLSLHKKVSVREKEVGERENKIDLIIAEIRQKAAGVVTEKIFELTHAVFRNPVVKRELHRADVTKDNYSSEEVKRIFKLGGSEFRHLLDFFNNARLAARNAALARQDSPKELAAREDGATVQENSMGSK